VIAISGQVSGLTIFILQALYIVAIAPAPRIIDTLGLASRKVASNQCWLSDYVSSHGGAFVLHNIGECTSKRRA
jgi:hypothetical protein